MTEMALVRAVNMSGTLAAGRHTIMTTDAVVHEGTVINNCRHPGTHGMTGITFTGRGNMTWPLTCGYHVIVAAAANTDYFIVIHSSVGNRYPRCRSRLMTSVAIIGTGYVCRRFA